MYPEILEMFIRGGAAAEVAQNALEKLLAGDKPPLRTEDPSVSIFESKPLLKHNEQVEDEEAKLKCRPGIKLLMFRVKPDVFHFYIFICDATRTTTTTIESPGEG